MWGSRAGAGAARHAGVVAIALASLAQPASLASPLAEGVGAVAPLERLLERPGPALRAAVTALERGEAQLADALLAAVAEQHALIADHADLLRLELRVESGRHAEAIALGKHWSHAGIKSRSCWLHTIICQIRERPSGKVASRYTIWD